MNRAAIRVDLQLIADMIQPKTRVLDIGCGDGALLEYLSATKNVDGRGLELSQQNVNACVARGLSVVQGDADTDLADYPAQIFDVAILSQTIQATRSPKNVLSQLLRIGKLVAVSIPNFGHWRIRLSLLFNGRMPRTKTLGYSWHETPNIHLCTIADFVALAEETGGVVQSALALREDGHTQAMHPHAWGPNLLAEGAIFFLRSKNAPST
jgi:methionine biosynthesis protein MetW